MMKKIALLLTCLAALASCSSFSDRDNAEAPNPLVKFTPEIRIQKMWETRTGFGIGSDYLKLTPALADSTLFVVNKNGRIIAIDALSGKKRWNVYTPLTIGSGPITKDGLILFGTREGELVALDQHNGKMAWQSTMPSEILATPAISNGYVVAKTIDGKVSAFSATDGQKRWTYQQTEPTLILRGSSAPQISQHSVVVGFANGNLAKLSLASGALDWQQMVATPEGSFAVQRMIDIDADPLIHNGRVYVATYQGRISALSLGSGQVHWTHNLSSYTGMCIDDTHFYVTDAKSHVWAFDPATGRVTWQQEQLEARHITAPVSVGDYLVVGDEQGYVHWLDKRDGHFVARVRVAGFGVIATPVVYDHVVYVLTRDGHLAAYRVN